MTYALDTGTIIALLNCDEAVTTRMDRAVFTGEKFIIPPIVDYEIQRGLLYKPSPKKEKMYFTLRKLYDVGVMMPEMWLRAAHIYVDLRQSGYTIGDDDIFIASFCLENGYTLITRNTKDFFNITELHIENWADEFSG